MPKIKIAVDAGHGSDTAGKRTPPLKKNIDIDKDAKIDIKKGTQYREHYANAGVANQLYNILKERGYEVIRSGWDDTNSKDDSDISLASRQSLIKKAKCDYSISIHFNAYGDGKGFNEANGVGVYIHKTYPGDSKKLADYALKELIKGSAQKNRGIHTEALAMCNCKALSTKASIICELAFMTNEHEATDFMANSEFWEESAKQIADALDRYCKEIKKQSL